MKIRKLKKKIDITSAIIPESEYVEIDGLDGRKIELMHNFNGILVDNEYLLSVAEALALDSKFFDKHTKGE